MEKYKNNNLIIFGRGDDPPAPQSRTPIEAPEGILTGDATGLHRSLTHIEMVDLLCEGEIEGLVSGEYSFSGALWATGYQYVSFSGYSGLSGVSLRSIFWNEVPVMNSQNQFNFQQINVAMSRGFPNGSLFSSSNANLNDKLTVSRSVGERLRGGEGFSKFYRILNKDCRGVNVNIKVSSLAAVSTDSATYGDINTTQVDYKISYKPIFSSPGKQPGYLGTVTDYIKGKISYGFIKSTFVDFYKGGSSFVNDQDFLGWELKVTRITDDSISTSLRNQTYIDSITELYNESFVYPNCAVVSSKFSAEYFSSVPSRAYDVKMLKVLVPSNYDPIKRVYGEENGGPVGTTSVWDGTFKTNKEWTDNPAWCYYDLITNNRYGLGKYIDSTFVDKWTLYNIAQYCDILVPDGYGGYEPRFSCNLILTSREEAYKVLSDMASIFRAIVYYAGGNIYAVQDSPKPAYTQFTNASVENGDFNYSSSSKRVRHTTALVRFNDKNDFYKPAIEYVEDIDGIKRYGIRQLELSAFGCTSRGQALRLGRWALLSETTETESVNFTAGLEATLLRPGDIIKVYDSNRKGKRLGGRVFDYAHVPRSGAQILLDDYITGFNSGQLYNLSLLTPTYNYDTAIVELNNSNDTPNIRRPNLQVFSFSGQQATGTGYNGYSKITLNTGVNSGDYYVSGSMIWMIEATGSILDAKPAISGGLFDYYRIIKIDEKEENKYDVAGIQYNESKFNLIDSGIDFKQVNFQNIIPQHPNFLSLVISPNSTPNVKIINYYFSSSGVSGVDKYLVYSKFGSDFNGVDISGNNFLTNILPTNLTSGSYIPSENGNYYFRVYGANNNGNRSNGFASNSIEILGINPIKDVLIKSLRLAGDLVTNDAGTRYTGEYTDASPTFTWQVGFNSTYIAPTNLKYNISIREPSPNNTPSPHIYYQTTGYSPSDITNPTYKFNISDNISAKSNLAINGPFREYDVVVEAINSGGFSSAGNSYEIKNGYDILYVNNPKATGLTLSSTGYNPSDPYYTDQWLTQDGDIKILIISGTRLNDIEGGIVYSSPFSFTREQALGFTTGPEITKTKFFEFTNPIIVSPQPRISSNEVYIGLSVVDKFDAAVNSDFNKITGLDVSNIVKARMRGGALKYVSPNQSIPTQDLSNIALYHGLGSSPDVFKWYLVCVATDLGYNVGDMVDLENITFWPQNSTNNILLAYKIPSYSNSTQIVLGPHYWTTYPLRLNNKTTAAIENITYSSWRIVGVALKY